MHNCWYIFYFVGPDKPHAFSGLYEINVVSKFSVKMVCTSSVIHNSTIGLQAYISLRQP
jgi:hypothetical protein